MTFRYYRATYISVHSYELCLLIRSGICAAIVKDPASSMKCYVRLLMSGVLYGWQSVLLSVISKDKGGPTESAADEQHGLHTRRSNYCGQCSFGQDLLNNWR